MRPIIVVWKFDSSRAYQVNAGVAERYTHHTQNVASLWHVGSTPTSRTKIIRGSGGTVDALGSSSSVLCGVRVRLPRPLPRNLRKDNIVEVLITILFVLAPSIIVLVLGIVGVRLFGPKMDPNVAELAELAYQFAATALDTKAKGKAPPVVLEKERFKVSGGTAIGQYSRRFRLPIIGYIYERVRAVNDASFMFANLAHEMAHAVRARAGKRVTEKEAEMVEALAAKHNSPTIAALLAKLPS